MGRDGVTFLLELLSEEIPARMQAAAAEQLRTRFLDACKAAALPVGAVVADATPRRLWLIAEDVAAASAAASEERRGPRADAPAAAIDGFLRSTGLTRDQLEERETPKGVFLYANIASACRPAAEILAQAVPEIVRGFQWPKSMRWGVASASTASPRWVRPLTGIVALLDGAVVALSVHGVASDRTTRGHRVHAPDPIAIDSAATYAEQLCAAHVIAGSAERRGLIEAGAAKLAADAGLTVIPDAGLVAENAGLTEWPVPLLGRFDSAFLAVPREVIQLTMRTNQKYFACADSDGALAPAFVCVANLDATDGGAAIVKGNERVLSARLSDARFFWEQDLATVKAGGLDAFLPRLDSIVFHEKLGTMADKVARVAALAKWLADSGAVPGCDPALAERAARLAKADLVSATVGEFPEVQGIAGRYLALAAGEDAAVADAIRDHYKPVGQGDDVPTAPVSVAVALADKLDSLLGFFAFDMVPTGSRDPFALRRAGLAYAAICLLGGLRISMKAVAHNAAWQFIHHRVLTDNIFAQIFLARYFSQEDLSQDNFGSWFENSEEGLWSFARRDSERLAIELFSFLADRLKVQQREAGVRHDLIDAVFALGGEDDLVRLLARVHALQAFIATDDGANLLAGYKRAANILRIEDAKDGVHSAAGLDAATLAEPAERALEAALDAALPAAAAAVAAEDFTAAMTALAGLRAPVDAFFAAVMVNDPDLAVRRNRLALLARFRDAVHKVADFSRIEG